ncbi:hypothetical protein [Methylobacterium sp. Leaf89]|uniref:hypothetical protein n=1 Tax=Methylobacterium sp. Leaf89 TaxID=1736245 RepID=UPI001AEC11C7|nr:hypothetical protein [Methylobacterium sp. Leaf89]
MPDPADRGEGPVEGAAGQAGAEGDRAHVEVPPPQMRGASRWWTAPVICRSRRSNPATRRFLTAAWKQLPIRETVGPIA